MNTNTNTHKRPVVLTRRGRVIRDIFAILFGSALTGFLLGIAISFAYHFLD